MAGSRFVMVCFGTEQEAEDFLTYIDQLDEHNRTLLLGTRTPDKKVKLTPFKIRTAYLKAV